MKRIFYLFLFLCFAFGLNAQNYNVNVSGTVTGTNGVPVSGVTMIIKVVFSNTGTLYSDTLQTDSNGVYSDQIAIPNTVMQGTVTVSMVNCNNTLVTKTAGFWPGAPNIVLNFTYCANGSGNNCAATINVSYNPAGNQATLTVTATGTAPFTYFWNNAGGTVSPSITVSQSGTYCVVVVDANGCSVTACATVQLGNPGSCSVQIAPDSTSAGVLGLTAFPTGTAPYTYLWNTGATTQSILMSPNMINYCVTVADAAGCTATDCYTYSPPGNCSVTISGTPNGALTAQPSGSGPFTYLWSNGQTTQTIQPNALGSHCVTVTSATTGCVATACYQFPGSGNCGVTITVTPTNPGAVGWTLTANATGTAPFTYQWNVQNWQTQTITVGSAGNYCVTITDASGCQATKCVTVGGNNNCTVVITQTSTGSNTWVLLANVPANAFTFLWSTGELTSSITPTTAGVYCVTVTGANGCTASDCYTFDPNQGNVGHTIKGYISLPDSSFFATLEGKAYLYALNLAVTGPVLVDEVAFQANPNGVLNFYDFGQVAAGEYLVKIALSPNSPYFPEYLPTYYGNVLFWNDATVITVPHSGLYFNVVLKDGNGANGPGLIGGKVTEGDGLVGNTGDNRGSGDPMPDVSVLLLNQQEQPVTHTVTDANGEYSFPDLAYGTYKVVVEITGKVQAFYWVTLSPNNESVTGLDFKVNENEVTGLADIKNAPNSFQVYPNPAKEVLNIQLESTGTFEARLSLTTLTGSTVFAQQKMITEGSQHFEISLRDLPGGIYFLQLATGKEVIAKKVVKE